MLRDLIFRPRPMPDTIELSDPPVTVRLLVSARARRFTLRLAAPGEGAVLTLPPGIAEAEVRGFLSRHSGWLARAVDRLPDAVNVEAGATVPVDGRLLRIEIDRTAGWVPRIEGGSLLLSPGRPTGPRVSAWLRERLRSRAAPLAARHAAEIGRTVTAISFRDTRSRWGSCSSAGRISLSWRLAMAPAEVQDYVTIHEVAHLREMNHSPRFWALVERMMPGHAAHRDWLKREGRRLHAYRFGPE